MKKINLIILSLIGAMAVHAQDYNDVLLYSQSFSEGDARFMAMGGALSSLGGNIGAMSVNPASSAVFKKSVIEFSPTYIYTKSENHYLGYDKAFTSLLKVPSFGLVGYKALKANDVFISGLSFGFALNSQNRYSETIDYTGINNNSSLTDDFVRLANANPDKLDDQYTLLAYDSYLIDYASGAKTYFSDFVDSLGNKSYGEFQDFTIERDGAKREILFNLGVDFSEYVFFGANLSFSNFYYSETKFLTEKDKAGTKDFLDEFTYSTKREVEGTGIGGKFGLIVRPIEYIRIGGAIHTPVINNINEDCDFVMNASYDQPINANGDYYCDTAKYTTFDYKVGQPAKFVGSLGFVYKNVVNIGVDLETMNYENCELRSNLQSMTDPNKQITDELQKVTNLKCGGEFRYGPFTFRAGYGMYGNPYKNIKVTHNTYSAGLGLATNTFYYDMAWMRSVSEQYNTLYTNLAGKDVTANSKIKRDYIMFTLGIKF